MNLLGRVKPIEAILATAEKKSLRRSQGAFQLTMLGIGSVIGAGIFVLSSEAAQKAGPGMMISSTIAGLVCGVAALCYSELAAMVPVAGSASTYAVAGEFLAWMVGWALAGASTDKQGEEAPWRKRRGKRLLVGADNFVIRGETKIGLQSLRAQG